MFDLNISIVLCIGKWGKKSQTYRHIYELAAIEMIVGTCIMSVPNFLLSTVSHCYFCCLGVIMA